MPAKPDPQPPHDDYRPVPWRRRVLIALLAVATAGVVIFELTARSGIVRHARQHRADVADCKPGQTADCVGSRTEVIAVPVPAAAPGASR